MMRFLMSNQCGSDLFSSAPPNSEAVINIMTGLMNKVDYSLLKSTKIVFFCTMNYIIFYTLILNLFPNNNKTITIRGIAGSGTICSKS